MPKFAGSPAAQGPVQGPANQVIRLADYSPHPRNYNQHPTEQIEKLAASLRAFGQVRSVVVWRRWFLAGTGLALAARSIGWTELRADVLPDDYPEARALAYLAADNELARQSDNDGAIFYNHRPRVQNKILETALDWNPGLPVRQIVIWNSHAGINFNPACYRGSHEWIVIFAKPDFGLLSRAHSAVGDVWDFGPAAVEGHPAPFPVAMVSRALETTRAQIVYEPFSGSGTTIIACENLGRKCRAVEISPAYVAVALERWAAHTGKTPVLLGQALADAAVL